MTATARPTTSATFAVDVIEASKVRPVLVDFWAPWCGPCQALGPVLDAIAAEFGDRVAVIKVNTDEEQAVASQYAIRSIPAVKLFRDGSVVAEFVGALPIAQVRAFLGPHLPPMSAAAHAAALALARAGDTSGALAALKQVISQDPANISAIVDAARFESILGDTAAARQRLRSLPPAQQSEAAVLAAYALLHFAELATTAPQDAAETTRARIAGAILGGSVDGAAEMLLEQSRASRPFAMRAGKDDLLQLFTLVGTNDPRVAAWRRRLAALLN
jgi:putative thioredoxin